VANAILLPSHVRLPTRFEFQNTTGLLGVAMVGANEIDPFKG
jgi:hypothetical protein